MEGRAMTREEYDAIRARAATTVAGPESAQVVLICVRGNVPVHPDELGPADAALFKARAEATATAARDRKALLEWIERDFTLPWSAPEPKE
jgi:hypothetical protein